MVHTHNLKTGLGELLEYTYEPEGHKDVEPTEPAYFDGYMRENGKVGVRNEVWIVPTVGCVNSIARAIEATARMNKPEGVMKLLHLHILTDVHRLQRIRKIQERFLQT